MAESKKKAFVNERKVEVQAGDFKGYYTIPVIMSDIDAGLYLEKQQAYFGKLSKAGLIDEETQLVSATPEEIRDVTKKDATQHTFDLVKHLVKSVNFPGVTMKNFRNNGERPYFVMVRSVVRETRGIVSDTFSTPN